MTIKISSLTDIYIGSGYKDFKGTSSYLVSETIKLNGKPVIPGSSFKGAVRAIARAASNSCRPNKPKPNKPNRPNNNDKSCETDNHCIVCDIFGMMGMSSKVIFPEFKAEPNFKITVKELNSQFDPKANEDGSKGYKFYKTGDNNYKMTSKIRVEVICKGSSFTGRIYFSNLTKEELALLSYSLALNSNDNQQINMKIGGFKNEGMGEVKISVTEFKVNKELKISLDKLAADYYYMSTANQKGIENIEGILERR